MTEVQNPSTDTRLRAARVSGVADLLDVRLTDAGCDLQHYGVPASLSTDESLDLEVSGADEKGLVIVALTFNVSITEDDEDDPEQLPTRARCRFAALYQVPHGFSATDDEYQAFSETVGLLALYPYVREMVQSLTVRMGLPPLVLRMVKQAIPPPKLPAKKAPAKKAPAKKAPAKKAPAKTTKAQLTKAKARARVKPVKGLPR